MENIKDSLTLINGEVRDMSISLLSDAVYRNDQNAKALERQCAKISRAIDKAIYEYTKLEQMQNGINSDEQGDY